jgi:hypothetical protein
MNTLRDFIDLVNEFLYGIAFDGQFFTENNIMEVKINIPNRIATVLVVMTLYFALKYNNPNIR